MPRSTMTYPSLGPVSVDSLRLSNTSSIGWSVTSCTPESESQSLEDKGFIERIAESASRCSIGGLLIGNINFIRQNSPQGRRGKARCRSPYFSDFCALFRGLDAHRSDREAGQSSSLAPLKIRKFQSTRSLSPNGCFRSSSSGQIGASGPRRPNPRAPGENSGIGRPLPRARP